MDLIEARDRLHYCIRTLYHEDGALFVTWRAGNRIVANGIFRNEYGEVEFLAHGGDPGFHFLAEDALELKHCGRTPEDPARLSREQTRINRLHLLADKGLDESTRQVARAELDRLARGEST